MTSFAEAAARVLDHKQAGWRSASCHLTGDNLGLHDDCFVPPPGAEGPLRGQDGPASRAGACRQIAGILAALDFSRGPEGMNLPGFRLHALKGPLKGHYAVSVSSNWRVTFRFEDGAAVNVDYVHYH